MNFDNGRDAPGASMHDSLTTEHYYRAVREASDPLPADLRNGWIHKVSHKIIKRRLFSNIHVLCTDPLGFLYSLPRVLFRQGALALRRYASPASELWFD